MRTAFKIAIALALSAGLFPALAQKPLQLPKGLPAYGPLQPFAPNVVEHRLSNGLTVWLAPRPGYPKVTFALAVRGGLANDPAAMPGLSDLLASTVTLGTKTRTASQIDQQIAAAGGEISARADKDDIVISTNVPSWKMHDGLAILADIAQNANFPGNQITLAKLHAVNALRGQESRPRFLAFRAMEKVVFGSNPYSVFAPTQASIAKMNADMLRSFYAQRFQPSHALLIVIGNFEPGSMMSAVSEAFGQWSTSQAGKLAPVPQPQASVAPGIAVVNRPGSVQTAILLASVAPTGQSPDYPAFMVANALYGGMFSARLDSDIREDKGYTYGAGSEYQTWAGTGLFFSAANVRNTVTGATLNEFLYQLNRMATTAPRPDEVERAQRHLVGSEALRMQSQESMAAQLAAIWSAGLTPADLARQNEAYLHITLNDVEAIGKKYFPAAKQNIVMVGDRNVIATQVAPFDLTLHPVP